MERDDPETRWSAAVARAMPRALAFAGAALLLLLLVALVWMVERSNQARDAANARERHSYDVMLLERGVGEAMATSEAALGRFVISGDRSVGTIYYDEWSDAGRQLERLRQMVGDNPRQVDEVNRLRALYADRGAELAAAAAQANYKRGWSALELYNRAGQSDTIPDIVHTLARIEANERQLLDTRSEHSALVTDQSNFLTALLSAAGLLLLLGGGILGYAAFSALQQRRSALADADAESIRATELEQAVKLRTQELSDANARLQDEMAERAAAEAQLRQIQKMEAVGQLTGGIAHDFNNMLAVVVGGLELARRRLHQGSAEVGRHIDNAMEGANRAAALTRRLLAFARAEPLLPERVAPDRLIAAMSDLLDRTLGERVRVETRLADGGWQLWIDPHQFENAIINLAVNARDAMDGEGRLVIETAAVRVEAGTVGEAAAGDYLRIAVTDDGAGMAPEVLERVFEPFFTTKPVGKGTGLGLSQIFGFVRQSHGDIVIESVEGQGTTVSLYLPRHEAVAAEEEEELAATSVPIHEPGAWVLVVEDDARVRAATSAGLEELGYRPIACAGGEEALALIAERDDLRLIVTDVVMPGMTGPELIRALSPLRAGLAVLYVTGYAGEAGEIDMLSGHELLRKPFTIAALGRSVADALARTPVKVSARRRARRVAAAS